MATYHGCQPCAHLGDWGMPALPQLGLDLLQLGPQALWCGEPMHHEPSLARPPTRVDEPQELEGLWLSFSALLSVLGGESPEFQQARFVRVQRQAELPEALPQGDQEPLGLPAVLEPDDEVVQIAHDDHLTQRCRPAPP